MGHCPLKKVLEHPLQYVLSTVKMIDFINNENEGSLQRPFILAISNELQKGKGAELHSPKSIACSLTSNTYFVVQ